MPHALIIGAGQIGRAVAETLLDRGWSATLASRNGGLPAELARRGATAVSLDRAEPGALARALGTGADLLLDTVAFDAADADQLVELSGDAGRIVAISSASVYRDPAGRTLDKARENGFPDLPERMTEDQPTVDPGPATYSTRKVAMERRLLDGARAPVTILRPCAIHGPHSCHPREWWFVKRLLDGRARIPLAHRGESRFHTSATVNIAALVAAVADARGTQVLNAVDPDPLSVREIGRTIIAALGRDAELIPVPDDGPAGVGATPWSIPRAFTFSDAAARTIGYAPVGAYAETAAPACRWLADHAPADWRAAFPALAAYPWNLFDYAREDAWLAEVVGADGLEPPTSSV